MVHGSKIQIMDMYGFRMLVLILFPTPQMVTGFLQMMDGHGYLIFRGDGLPFIMEDGTQMNDMVQCGFRIINGVQDG
jgi:hypothetical protein